jgi:hypothetical protein
MASYMWQPSDSEHAFILSSTHGKLQGANICMRVVREGKHFSRLLVQRKQCSRKMSGNVLTAGSLFTGKSARKFLAAAKFAGAWSSRLSTSRRTINSDLAVGSKAEYRSTRFDSAIALSLSPSSPKMTNRGLHLVS